MNKIGSGSQFRNDVAATIFTPCVRSTKGGYVFTFVASTTQPEQVGTPTPHSTSPAPWPGQGYPHLTLARTGGTPLPLPQPWQGDPRQESECCYAAGDKPLAVTQEDFLATSKVTFNYANLHFKSCKGLSGINHVYKEEWGNNITSEVRNHRSN